MWQHITRQNRGDCHFFARSAQGLTTKKKLKKNSCAGFIVENQAFNVVNYGIVLNARNNITTEAIAPCFEL